MLNPTEEYLPGSEPSKKIKKEPTGILKDLLELKRYSAEMDGCECCGQWVSTKEDKDGDLILRSDVEAIINKYLNP